jgi:hypothetical protein
MYQQNGGLQIPRGYTIPFNKTREKANKTSEEEILIVGSCPVALKTPRKEGPNTKWVISPQRVA